jgi:hypothetical protein
MASRLLLAVELIDQVLEKKFELMIRNNHDLGSLVRILVFPRLKPGSPDGYGDIIPGDIIPRRALWRDEYIVQLYPSGTALSLSDDGAPQVGFLFTSVLATCSNVQELQTPMYRFGLHMLEHISDNDRVWACS